MALNWEKMFKRYVFDEARTPQFVAVSKLSRTQAHYEILFYTILVVPICLMSGVLSLSGKLPHGNVPMIAMYAFVAAWATIVFAWNKNQIAGTFSATVPVALLIYFVSFGFPEKMSRGDSLLVIAVVLAWVAYNWRIVRIAAGYPEMIDRPDSPQPLPRRRAPDYMDDDPFDENNGPNQDKKGS